MPYFGSESLDNIEDLHPILKRLLLHAIKHVDFKVLCGFRGEAAQHAAFLSGASEKDWPNSKHNKKPSTAADVILYFKEGEHIRWSAKESQYMFIGFLRGLSIALRTKIRVGADWDGDFDIKDQKFNDIVHIELGD